MNLHMTHLFKKIIRTTIYCCLLFSALTAFAEDRDLYDKAARHYDLLLQETVTADGVDYNKLAKNQNVIELYLYAISVAQLDNLRKNEKLALYINAYNVFVIRLILDYWPYIKSIKNIPEYPLPRRFKDKRWRLGGNVVSLNDVERNYIDPLQEPTAYMALVCATKSCPDLRAGIYTSSRIKKQLIDATKTYLSQKKALDWGMRKVFIGRDKPTIYLSDLFRWEKVGIEFSGYTLLSFVEEFAPTKARKFIAEHRDRLSLIYLDYDWGLNASTR